MRGSEGVCLYFRPWPVLDSPYLCPTPLLHVLRFTPLPSRSQPGSPGGLRRGHEVPVLEQSPHCLQPWVSVASPAHPQCWPRGSESVPGAGGLTSAPTGAGTPGLGPTSCCLHLPALTSGGWPAARPDKVLSALEIPSGPALFLRPPAGTGSLPVACHCRPCWRSGLCSEHQWLSSPGAGVCRGLALLLGRRGCLRGPGACCFPLPCRGICHQQHVVRLGLCPPRALLQPPGAGREMGGQGASLPLMPTFCLQGLPPVPFGSGLAPEGAPPLAAEGLPERFTSPAERPAPSYSSMEEVD